MPAPLPPAVGFPTPEGVFVSKSDWAKLIERDVGLRQVIEALASCLRARPR